MKIFAFLSPTLPLFLAGCGTVPEASKNEQAGEAHQEEDGRIVLTPDQIAAAGIELGRASIGGSGSLELPATIEGDPQGTQVVPAAIGGRIVALTRNLGQSVRRGETLALIESREAAQLQGDVEASRARLTLANSTLAREERLFAQRVSPEQDVIAARTAATEARIAYRQAQQQLAAAVGGGGSLNRIAIAAPLSGQVIARSVTLGQTVAADAELYRVANLSSVALSLHLQPADAGRIRPGTAVTVTAPGRQAIARISFVSPVLDSDTRLVPVIAILDNRKGQWRVGEPVQAAIPLQASGQDRAIRVASTAIQTVEGKTVVFVRTRTGFQAISVMLGDASGDSVIVRAGLRGHEQIATTNSFTLKAELGKGEAGHED